MFRNMLDYKLAWKGKELIKIDRIFPFKLKNAVNAEDEKRAGIIRKSIPLHVWK